MVTIKNQAKYRLLDTYLFRSTAHDKRRIVDLLSISDPNELLSVLSSDAEFCECVSSGSLSFYKSLCHKNIKKEKISNNLLHSLIGYCSRVYARATPYGLFAGVSSGTFEDKCSILYDTIPAKDKIVQSDSLWVFSLIQKLENIDSILTQLKITTNPNCYSINSRYKNPHVSDFGGSNKSKSTSSIKKTKPLDYIISAAKDPIMFSTLVAELSEKLCTPKQVVFDYVKNLVKSEYLLTELRTPVLAEEPLQHIITILEHMFLEKDDLSVFLSVKEIYSLINKYNENPAQDLYLMIVSKMGNLINNTNNTNCLHTMYSVGVCENTLSEDVYNELTDFANILPTIVSDIHVPIHIKNYKKLFLEKYNNTAEVKIVELLDDDIGLGNPYEKSINETLSTDKTFFHYMDYLINLAIMQGEKKVLLRDSDIAHISSLIQPRKEKLKDFSGSFELCVKILSASISELNKGNYSIIIGENVGSDRCGAHSNRFSRIMSDEYISKKVSYYERLKEAYGSIALIDAKELPTKGRLSNVTCGNINYDNVIMLGYYWPNENQIDLNDIVIGYDSLNDILYARSLSKNAIIKVDSDNMLNCMSNSPHLRFLREISYAYSAHSLSIFGELPNDKVYCPEIRYGKIIIKPETWNLSNLYISTVSYNIFCSDINQFAERFNMPKYIYLCDGDNTVLLNIYNDLCLQYLYKELKTKHSVKAIASDYNFYSTWDSNDHWNDYMTEYVFSFIKASPLDIVFPTKKCIASELDSQRKFGYGECNWLYCKIYLNPDYRGEYISQIGILLKQLHENSLIDKGYFIQYSDATDGYHIRIRFHANQNTDLVKNYFIQWLNTVSENYSYKKICFDTYEREVERYGGKYAIDLAEELFFADSLLVSCIHRYNSLWPDGEETIAFYLSFSLLQSLFGNIELLSEELDKFITHKENKREYNRAKKDFESIASQPSNFITEKEIFDLVNNRNTVARLFRDQVLGLESSNRLASTKKDIYFSINHMLCNRLKADNAWERKILSFVRHFAYDVCQKQKHFKAGDNNVYR